MKNYLAKMKYNLCDEIDFTWYAVVTEEEKNDADSILDRANKQDVVISQCTGNLDGELSASDVYIKYWEIPNVSLDFFDKLVQDRAFCGEFWNVISGFKENLKDSEEN